MVKTKKKWGFLAPTRKEAERMEAKYKVHFTPLIDYMEVIFPDIDDWEEEPFVNDAFNVHVDNTKDNDFSMPLLLKPNLFSRSRGIIVHIGTSIQGYIKENDRTPWTPALNSIVKSTVYGIAPDTQLTNATVKQIFGVDVAEPLFDENTPTFTQPWIPVDSAINAETALKGKYIGDEKQYQVNFNAYQASYDNIGLSKIIVDGLFDLYNYKIDLNTDSKISILIGPNGCGKTTILKIIRFMLSGIGDLEEIKKTPFKSITCILANGRKIKLKSSNNKLSAFIDNKKVAVFLKNEEDYMEDKEFSSLCETLTKEIRENAVLLNKETGNLSLETNYGEGHRKEYTLNIKDIMNKQIEGVLKKTGGSFAKVIYENSLKKYNCYFDTEFISAQRLLGKVNEATEEETTAHQYFDSIVKIKKDFKSFCEETEKKYNKEKSIAERDLLDEYMYGSIYGNVSGCNPNKILDNSAFEKQWKEFIEKRGEYEDLAFLELDEEYVPNDYIGEVYDKDLSTDKKDFLCIYLEQFKKTLVGLEQAYNKIRLFQKIINKRFEISQKQLQYRYGEMYLAIGKGKNKKEIPLDVLSSGEKNDFIMFYNLIFNCKNSKVLIDEPEISLHIEWQERFINDLSEICKMNNIQALVATHSPNIINDHTNLIAKWEIKDEL